MFDSKGSPFRKKKIIHKQLISQYVVLFRYVKIRNLTLNISTTYNRQDPVPKAMQISKITIEITQSLLFRYFEQPTEPVTVFVCQPDYEWTFLLFVALRELDSQIIVKRCNSQQVFALVLRRQRLKIYFFLVISSVAIDVAVMTLKFLLLSTDPYQSNLRLTTLPRRSLL